MHALTKLLISLTVGLFITVEGKAQSQYKQEEEKRIRKREMPNSAVRQLDDWLDNSRRIRFYFETDGENTSYEAKMVRDRRHYSIEFDQEGKLQDIEELIRFDQIPDLARASIDSILTENYDKYTVQRAQCQYIIDNQGDSVLTLAHVEGQNNNNYELEVEVRESTRVNSYEMLFDQRGQLLRKRIIVKRSLDNFLY